MWPLLVARAFADTTFSCDTVATPEDAWTYYAADPNDAADDAQAELEAWYDSSCPTASCGTWTSGSHSCDEIVCTTSAGADYLWRDEVLASGEEVITLEVTPPASAGLDWTWASVVWDDDASSTTHSTQIDWTGVLFAGGPADSSATGSTTFGEHSYGWDASASWTSDTCTWRTWEGDYTDSGNQNVVVNADPTVLVEWDIGDCVTPGDYFRRRASVDGVLQGAVLEDGWAPDPDDADRDGYITPYDCNDADAAVHPCATDHGGDGVDTNCDGREDVDGDGHYSLAESGDDCDDADATIHPGAVDVPYDGIDQDCSGADSFDGDGDGAAAITSGGDDCDDTDGTVYVGAVEIAYDGVDQDCDGADLTDVDGDGSDAVAAGGDDCADGDAAVHVGAVEVPYDGVDQDCSGADLADVDGDGADALAAGGDDCDDTDATVFVGAVEVECDTLDQDCDGADACATDTGTPAEDTGDGGCSSSSDGGGCGGAVFLFPGLGLLGLAARRRRASRRA